MNNFNIAKWIPIATTNDISHKNKCSKILWLECFNQLVHQSIPSSQLERSMSKLPTNVLYDFQSSLNILVPIALVLRPIIEKKNIDVKVENQYDECKIWK